MAVRLTQPPVRENAAYDSSWMRGTVQIWANTLQFFVRLPLTLCLAVFAAFIGCATRVPHTEPPPTMANGTYVDLQPGWRIRTVTPILRSGKFMPDFKATAVADGAIELSAGDDFIGYETSYYLVTSGKQSGIAVAFASAENTIDGKTYRQAQPLVRVFDFSGSARYMRLIFLTRVSRADHNQAILVAASLDDLNRLTQQVESDPAKYCGSQWESHCTWVPEGISVQAERRDPAHRKNWIPVP